MKKKVVMLGSFVADLMSRQKGLPRPGETIMGSYYAVGAGGKGSNQAVAAHRAGADVVLSTKLGRDMFGEMALDFYAKEGISTEYTFQDENLATGAALILVDENTAQNAIVVVPSACMNILPAEVESLSEAIRNAGVLLVQLEINPDATFAAIDIAYRADVPVVLNPAPAGYIPDEVFKKIHVITPNETEAEALTGITVACIDDARRAAVVLREKGVDNVVITLGSRGAFLKTTEYEMVIDSICVDAIDTTGAGDAFNGGLAAAMAEGMELSEAVKFANCVGALSVTRQGTAPAMPHRAEIEALMQRVYGQ